MLCVFDINETLLDLTPLDEVFGSPETRREWFALLIHTALTVTATGGYRDFAGIAGAAATTVAASHGRRLSDDERTRIGTTMRSLPAHPDVPNGLARLRDAGFSLVALGNSPLATIEAQLQHAELRHFFDHVFSAERQARSNPPPHRTGTYSTPAQGRTRS